MADSGVMREFLVALGFQINTSQEKKFVDTVTTTTVQVLKLGAAATATAITVVAGVAKIADSLERLYFASKRTNASVENIQALGYALDNMGSSSEAALQSIESIARLLRNSPGGEGLLKNIGVQTRDASGGLRDTVDMLGDLGAKLAAMPYYRANAYAQALGIDEKTLMALREGVGQFSDEYRQMLRETGADSDEAAKKSHNFMVQLRGVTATLGLLVQKSIAGVEDQLGSALEAARRGMVANFGKITDAATKVLLVIVKIGDALGRMVVRGLQVLGYLVDRFNSLSDESQTIIKWLGIMLVAWRSLNAGFLATPLGRIIALISALALLWDDYKTWKEGGKSLIDWEAWAPGIEKVLEFFKTIGLAIHESLGFLGEWRGAFEIFLAYVTGAWLFGMLGAIGKVASGLLTAGTAATGAAAASVVPVAAAGVAGYAAGSVLYEKYLRNTDVGDSIGAGVAHVLSYLGVKDAQDADDSTARAQARAARPAPSAPARRASSAAPAATEPRGIRNNNPGNIEYGNFARQQGATGAEPAGRFAMFADAQQGLNAIATLLRGKAYGGAGIDSVSGILNKYAPSADGNNTAAYVKNVAGKLGVDEAAHLDLSDPKIMAGMVDAIVRVENGKNPYSREMIDQAAGGKTVEIKQETNITVTGNDAARQVEQAQDRVNDRLMRNVQGRVR